MKELTGNIWDYWEAHPDSWLAITTNAFVNKRGEAVMGRGIALETKNRFPGFATKFGTALRESPEKRIHIFPEHRIICYQVKYAWFQDAKLILIEQSARELLDWMDQMSGPQGIASPTVFMVRPGCGNGHLQWDEVKPVLEKYFLNDGRLNIVER